MISNGHIKSSTPNPKEDRKEDFIDDNESESGKFSTVTSIISKDLSMFESGKLIVKNNYFKQTSFTKYQKIA